MYWSDSTPEDQRSWPWVFYHATDSLWTPGSPLLTRNHQVELGLRDEAEWAERYRGRLKVGHDWDVVCFFEKLSEVREYARNWSRRERGWILRVEIPEEFRASLKLTAAEQACAFLGDIPVEWISVVEPWSAPN